MDADTRQKSTRFKKGQSGNPGGRHKVPAELVKAQRMNQVRFAQLLDQYFNGSLVALREKIESDNPTTIDYTLARYVYSCATSEEPNVNLFSFLLDRWIGKVKESVEITQAKPTVIQLLNNEGTIVLGRENDEINSRSVEQLPEPVSGD